MFLRSPSGKIAYNMTAITSVSVSSSGGVFSIKLQIGSGTAVFGIATYPTETEAVEAYERLLMELGAEGALLQ